MAKDKPIGGMAANVLKLLISILKKKIDKIKAEGLKPLVYNVAGTLEKIIEALSDDNANNKEQLKQIQQDAIVENVIDYHQYLVDNHIAKLNDVNLRNGATIVLAASRDVAIVLTDDNPDNSAQLKELLENYDAPTAGAAQDILISFIEKKIEEKGGNDTLETLLTLLKFVDVKEIVDKE